MPPSSDIQSPSKRSNSGNAGLVNTLKKPIDDLLVVDKSWAAITYDDGGGVEIKESLVKLYSTLSIVSVITMLICCTSVIFIPDEIINLTITENWVKLIYQGLALFGIFSSGQAVFLSLYLLNYVTMVPSKRFGDYVYSVDNTIPLFIKPLLIFALGCLVGTNIMRVYYVFGGLSLAVTIPGLAFFTILTIFSRFKLYSVVNTIMTEAEEHQNNDAHISLPRNFARRNFRTDSKESV